VTALLDQPALESLAAGLAGELGPGDVVWLSGELGAGKTTFVRALVRAAGAAQPATSPTYSLVHRYSAPQGPLYHVDCYRLKHEDEAWDLDWDTLGQGTLLIEWPEKAGRWAPRPTRRVRLAHTPNPEVRRVEVE
jgi:tRNA threonylcarbamoyl adenosine modification protein YjeE